MKRASIIADAHQLRFTLVQVVVFILVGLVVVAGAVALLVRQRRSQTAAVLADSLATRKRFDELTVGVDALTANGSQLLTRLGGKVGADISTMLTELDGANREASAAVAKVPTADATKFSVTEAGSDQRSAERSLKTLKRKMHRGEELVEEAVVRVDAVFADLDELQRTVATGHRTAEDRSEAGWNMEPIVEELSSLTVDVEKLKVTPPIDLAEVEPQLKTLTDRASGLVEEADGVADEHRRLVELSVEQWKRVTDLRGEAEWLTNQLEAWVLLHNHKSLEAVSEHPPALIGRLDEADGLLEEAGGDAGMLAMGRQDVRSASDNLERSGQLIDQADALVAEARHLNVELATAAVEAEGLVVKAKAAGDDLAAYVAEHSHDLEADFAESAASLQSLADDAADRFALRPPDALHAMRLSNQAIKRAAEQSSAAQAEVQRMEKLRKAAQNSLRSAKTAVKELDRYTSGLFASVFGGQRRGEVDRLQRRLDSAHRLNELSVNRPNQAKKEAAVIAREARNLLEKYKQADSIDDYDFD